MRGLRTCAFVALALLFAACNDSRPNSEAEAGGRIEVGYTAVALTDVQDEKLSQYGHERMVDGRIPDVAMIASDDTGRAQGKVLVAVRYDGSCGETLGKAFLEGTTLTIEKASPRERPTTCEGPATGTGLLLTLPDGRKVNEARIAPTK